MMNKREYQDIILFIKELERLKDNTRTAWTGSGRRESVAEHSWRLSLFAFMLEDFFPDCDFKKVIPMCLIHDLGEAYEGDVSATLENDPEGKLLREAEAMNQLLAPLPEHLKTKIMDLWDEYNGGRTREAILAKALDKMETIIQHNQGSNPPDFDYAFNLGYGSSYAELDPTIKALREIIDRDTKSRMASSKK